MKKHILVVDNDLESLSIVEETLKGPYIVTLLKSEEETLLFLLDEKPDLILMDMDMIEKNGYETIRQIKKSEELTNIPILVLTTEINDEKEIKAIEAGVVDFIRKPLMPEKILRRIRVHLGIRKYRKELEEKVEQKTQMIQHLQDVIILSLAELVECRDTNTGGHVKRTAKYVEILTNELISRGVYKDILTTNYVKDIIRSAPLHDVGKIGINDATLLKAGSLDEDEFEFMKQHTTLGADALQKIINETNGENFLYIAKNMAYYHHEKWNGLGYPKGLSGEEIPVCARIMAVGDVYDALTTMRSYKDAFTHERAVELILSGRGTNFDPKIIDVFEEISYKFKLVKEKIEG